MMVQLDPTGDSKGNPKGDAIGDAKGDPKKFMVQRNKPWYKLQLQNPNFLNL